MTRPARILLVDDEASIQRTVVPLLASRGYEVRGVRTARSALDDVTAWTPDLIILDLGLPDLDGAALCAQIRAHSDVPIIVLSVRGGEQDKVAALDRGADDYVTKPFGSEELLARIRTALRRTFRPEDGESGVLEIDDLLIDFDRRRVSRAGEELHLTPKEFDLLALLARNAGRVLTHRTILRTIWGPHAVTQPEHLWVLVRQLRRKIERNPGMTRYVQSEPWVGYRFGS